MEGPIRILHVLGRLDRGGAETMVMNLYRYIDRSRVQFDFVIHTEERCDFTEEVGRLGGRIYSMQPFCASTALYYRKQWRRFFRKHPEYRIIHGHMRSTASLYLWEAKRAGLVTIVHSHNTSSGQGVSAFVKNILQYPLRYEADHLFACSEAAGSWLYGKSAPGRKNFHLLPNGIEPGAFHFEYEVREKKRRELLLQDIPAWREKSGLSLLLHVGRLEEQKNHRFLLRVMKALTEKNHNAVLLLCGEGPLEREILDQAEQYGIRDHVCLLGVRGDVPALMQAADAVVFPSLFEGLPVTLVEAQAAGLPVLMSDTITGEVILTDLVRTMQLTESAERWAEQTQAMLQEEKAPAQAQDMPREGKAPEQMREMPRGGESPAQISMQARRGKYADIIARKGYDVKENAEKLAAFYLSLWRKS